jgi:hypothetical protein
MRVIKPLIENFVAILFFSYMIAILFLYANTSVGVVFLLLLEGCNLHFFSWLLLFMHCVVMSELYIQPPEVA